MAAAPQRSDLWDNPMGTDGFEFVEYTGPDPQALGALFERMGFAAAARHRSKNVTLYKQGDVMKRATGGAPRADLGVSLKEYLRYVQTNPGIVKIPEQ